MSTLIATFEKNRREQIRVVLDEFKGVEICHVRVFVPKDEQGGFAPTQKGIAIRVEQLPDLIAALQKADAVRRSGTAKAAA